VRGHRTTLFAEQFKCCAARIPDDVVDDNNVLIVKTLAVTDERSATLQPDASIIVVHQAPVVAQRLTFVQHYNHHELVNRTYKQEAQLPLREQGVSFALSSYLVTLLMGIWPFQFCYTLRVGFLANLHGNRVCKSTHE